MSSSLRIPLLIGLGLAAAFSAWARPRLPDPPLGTGSAGFGGGGAAHLSGVDAVFINPGALSILDGQQLEAGMMGMSNSVSPYLLFGSRAGEYTTYTAGYFFDGRNPNDTVISPARQGVVAGAAFELASYLTLGTAVHCLGTGEGIGVNGFGVDADVGGVYRPSAWADVGLAIRNLDEAGVGQKPAGYETRRCYVVASEFHRAYIPLGFMRMRDPTLDYEFRVAEPDDIATVPSDFTHIFSIGARFTPGGRLGLRSTFRLSPQGTPAYALGVSLKLPVKGWGFACDYAFDSGGKDGLAGETAASHSLSISFKFGGKGDRIPPKVWIRADRLIVNPNAEKENDQLHFSLYAGDGAVDIQEEDAPRSQGQVATWTLEICAVNKDGSIGYQVRLFQGRDLPPRQIRWDGREEIGNPLPPGFYAFRLKAEDLAGNANETAWQFLEIKP